MALPTRVNRSQAIDPVEAMQREFDSMFGRYLTGRGGNDGGRLAPYGVDVREDADHIYVEAELPGFRKDDVDITLENQTLTISAERKEQTEPGKQSKGELLLNERRYTQFLRSFTLPPTATPGSPTAASRSASSRCTTAFRVSPDSSRRPRRVGGALRLKLASVDRRQSIDRRIDGAREPAPRHHASVHPAAPPAARIGWPPACADQWKRLRRTDRLP